MCLRENSEVKICPLQIRRLVSVPYACHGPNAARTAALWLPRSDGEILSVAVSRDKIALRSAESVWAYTGCFQPKVAILTRHMHVSELISEPLLCLVTVEGKVNFNTAVADIAAHDGKSQTGCTAFQLDIPSSQSAARGWRQQRVIGSYITSRSVVP